MRHLKILSPKHQQLARLLVGGHSQAEIARILTLNKATVSRLVHDPIVAGEVKRLQEMADSNSTICVPGISEKISDGALRGIEVLESILKDERKHPDILKLQANVSLELLARAGYGAVKQVQIAQASISTCLTREDIEELKLRAKNLEDRARDRIESKK
jgi:hypothetical protein